MRCLTPLVVATWICSSLLNPALGEYGVDVTWPMQYEKVRSHPDFVGKQKFYDDFMDGCRKFYGDDAHRCNTWEKYRTEMNLRQPQSMVNYTSTGYLKIKAPESVMALVKPYWATNRYYNKTESWPKGYTITNHWESPSFMVSVEDETLVGGGKPLKSQIWHAVREVIEEWTGQELVPCSLYGIRVYTGGSILASHVDRLPLVGSAIINVDQDVDEPWPLEVIDRQGRAVNVTIQPGEMILYESHSLLHGRPFPLMGRYFANIFIHFEPTGRPMNRKNDSSYFGRYDFALPPYIIPGSLEQSNWESENPNGWKMPVTVDKDPYLAHAAAMHGDLVQLTRLAKVDENLIHKKDENGWRPFHEACRSGQRNIIDYLLQHGADINEKTISGDSPLRLARKYLPANHTVPAYLESLGAQDIGASEQADPYIAHKAAMTGDLTQLAKLAELDEDLIHKPDENGWRPLHEAARTGQTHVIKFLMERGADINDLTDKGESPLHLARSYLAVEHPFLEYLESLGAEDVEPEL